MQCMRIGLKAPEGWTFSVRRVRQGAQERSDV